MNRSDCTAKMESLLEVPTYKKLKRKPTTGVKTRISSALKELGQKDYLSNKQHQSLFPSFSTAPQIQNLPNIHKEGTLLRPIVSAIKSPTQQAIQLVRILNPLQGTTDSYVTDSTHFVQCIAQISLRESDIMVNFDMVSLFTRVPVDEAL